MELMKKREQIHKKKKKKRRRKNWLNRGNHVHTYIFNHQCTESKAPKITKKAPTTSLR